VYIKSAESSVEALSSDSGAVGGAIRARDGLSMVDGAAEVALLSFARTDPASFADVRAKLDELRKVMRAIEIARAFTFEI